jgi:hypothetical protein
MTTPDIDLGRFGVFSWDPGSSFLDLGLAVTPEQAREIERLGYGTLWVTGSPAAELFFAEPLLESTTALTVATGIVNIWTADAKTVAESFHRINTALCPFGLPSFDATHHKRPSNPISVGGTLS